uniref:Pleckstrin homology domain-containing family O member 1-A-like n=1 Tax=Hippocampus comes TaxID=109280 RepID=A0A3Q3E8I6_HIPCM
PMGSHLVRQHTVSAPPPPDKFGWLRKFCGRGIFRELWRSRYVVLRGEHLFISEKEVRDERKSQEVVDLADYERSEELRKAKSRSKKNHSRFTLIRCRRRGNTVPNLLFLAVSPEEKESWITALNVAIAKAKNRVLDQVTMEEDVLVHPTRDRAKIPQGRRLPTRGHLMTVASSSCHGMLALDLVAEEEGFSECDGTSWESVFRVGSNGRVATAAAGGGGRQRSGTDVSKLRVRTKEPKVKTGSLPRGSERSWGKYSHLENSKVTPQPGKRNSIVGRSRCASMDEVLSSRWTQRLEMTELQKAKAERERGGSAAFEKGVESPRLHHLRGGDSPHSRSHKNRSRDVDSPRSRGSRSSACPSDSPRLIDSPDPSSEALRLPESPPITLGPDSGAVDLPTKTPQKPKQDEVELQKRCAEAERLLVEAMCSWQEAQEVLQEVKELQSHTLRRQRRRTYEKMTPTTPASPEGDSTLMPT